MVYASSSSVYGANKKIPFSTDDKVDKPVSLYAATKKSNELMAYTYSHLYGIPATGLRFFTVYGPYGRPDMAYFAFTKAILAGEPIKVFNHGDMYRDFTYIDDIIAGIINGRQWGRIILSSEEAGGCSFCFLLGICGGGIMQNEKIYIRSKGTILLLKPHQIASHFNLALELNKKDIKENCRSHI